ncbi:hypothetical protein IW261DRAFT_1421913 [Armillaria novae-zelandiae]|uniref:Uncharacterized protein n=1 Tax=Armillaria novae-zelandiae TaxID=153914 RepID=A0AA39P226_9AGAR|nr:hypothetical protein IW261DRAFT_1421913 [Armillaria novae-zelandiae]
MPSHRKLVGHQGIVGRENTYSAIDEKAVTRTSFWIFRIVRRPVNNGKLLQRFEWFLTEKYFERLTSVREPAVDAQSSHNLSLKGPEAKKVLSTHDRPLMVASLVSSHECYAVPFDETNKIEPHGTEPPPAATYPTSSAEVEGQNQAKTLQSAHIDLRVKPPFDDVYDLGSRLNYEVDETCPTFWGGPSLECVSTSRPPGFPVDDQGPNIAFKEQG